MPEETEVSAQQLTTEEWASKHQTDLKIPVVVNLWTDATTAERKNPISARHKDALIDVVPPGCLRFLRGNQCIWPKLQKRLTEEQLQHLRLRSVQLLNSRELIFDFEFLLLRVSLSPRSLMPMLIHVCDYTK